MSKDLLLIALVAWAIAGHPGSAEDGGLGVVEVKSANSLCELPENNDKLIGLLTSRVDEFYDLDRRKKWKGIVKSLMYPNEHPDDPTWRRRQVKIWAEEYKYIQNKEWRRLRIRQCGRMALVSTRVWWTDTYPSDAGEQEGFTDEHSWWIHYRDQWYYTEEQEARFQELGVQLGGSYEGTEDLYVEPPRVLFHLVWSAHADLP